MITRTYYEQTWTYKIDPPVFEPDSFGQRLLLSRAAVRVLNGGHPDVTVDGPVATKEGKRRANAGSYYIGYGVVSKQVMAEVLAVWQQDGSNSPCVHNTDQVD